MVLLNRNSCTVRSEKHMLETKTSAVESTEVERYQLQRLGDSCLVDKDALQRFIVRTRYIWNGFHESKLAARQLLPATEKTASREKTSPLVQVLQDFRSLEGRDSSQETVSLPPIVPNPQTSSNRSRRCFGRHHLAGF